MKTTTEKSGNTKSKSIELLNRAVADELSAVHQYMYFHFHCDDQGYDLLSNLFRRTANEEMLHAERLAERILFLKGEVEMKASGEVKKVLEVKPMLELAAGMETHSVADYNRWANECAQNADSVSKKLFETLVEDEERHFDQYDKEMENLEKFGDEYLALQSIERSKRIATQAPPSAPQP
jgi:bacterioferritin